MTKALSAMNICKEETIPRISLSTAHKSLSNSASAPVSPVVVLLEEVVGLTTGGGFFTASDATVMTNCDWGRGYMQKRGANEQEGKGGKEGKYYRVGMKKYTIHV